MRFYICEISLAGQQRLVVLLYKAGMVIYLDGGARLEENQ